MVIDLQETFSVRFGQEDLSAVKTVGDLIDLVERRVRT
jgi:acyl carrier protein